MSKAQAVQPSVGICDLAFQYDSSVSTDVSKTLARFGYQPPDRGRQMMAKLLLNGVDPRVAQAQVQMAVN